MSYGDLESFNWDEYDYEWTDEDIAEFEALFGEDEFKNLFGGNATYSYYVSYESSGEGDAAGAAVGAVVVLLCCGGICCYYYRKKQKE
jgi:hypothetical protein